MVAICHNMDLGDAVEHSDTPEYPEEYSAQGDARVHQLHPLRYH